jgi:hypothetical protein
MTSRLPHYYMTVSAAFLAGEKKDHSTSFGEAKRAFGQNTDLRLATRSFASRRRYAGYK